MGFNSGFKGLIFIESARTAQSVLSLVYELDVRDIPNPFLANRLWDPPLLLFSGYRNHFS